MTFLGYQIITNADTLKEKPDMVRRFVAATLKGLEYAKANPDDTIDMLVKSGADMAKDRAYVLSALKGVTLALMESDASKGKPAGWQSTEEWQGTLDTMVKYGGLDKAPTLNQLFTSDFLPK